jgi:hypothetical protein
MTPDTTPEAVYLIRKHGGYYRPNSRGYTTSAIVAGRYTQEQAERETHPNGPDGPRDGMTYIHENDVQGDEGWDAYRAQSIRIAELEAENAILRTEKHADAEAIGALLSALTEIRDWRKSCHDHDKDMGHDPREFDVEDLKMVEFRASAAIKGVTNV